MKIIDTVNEIVSKTQHKRMNITIGEAFGLWEHLTRRYDAIHKTQLYSNFITDQDFIIVVERGIAVLEKQINQLETLAMELGVSLPDRPPINTKPNMKLDLFTDRFIFKEILCGIQVFMDVHISSYRAMLDPKIRKVFRSFLNEEMDLFDAYLEYGKIKGWVSNPPSLDY